MVGQEITWDGAPSYREFLWEVASNCKFRLNGTSLPGLQSYLNLVKENGPTFQGVTLLVLVAVLMTLLRGLITDIAVQPLCNYWKVSQRNHPKAAENIWKFSFYSTAWVYTYYIVIIKYGFFQKPSILFADWDIKADVPQDIQLLYFVESGFYLHSMYTLFFMDAWRKDSWILLLHHLLTLVLLTCSYLGRYTQIGTTVIFFHDSCDIVMEFAKCSSYFSILDGNPLPRVVNLTHVSWVFFMVTWYVSRVYYFPLVSIHTLSLLIKNGEAAAVPLIYLGYYLLLVLLVMNIYWTVLIVALLVRVLRGRDLRDTRDYDEEKMPNKESNSTLRSRKTQ